MDGRNCEMPEIDDIYERLRQVYDPELGVNLVDLGLIYDVEIDGSAARIVMTLTTQGCPMHASLAPAVRAAVLTVPGLESVDVDVVWEPPWTPERLSPAGMLALGWL
jgi:metal-sulfur cluster biosynthetic enzyme